MAMIDDDIHHPEIAKMVEIIYADQSLLAVNKPAGIPSLPDGYDPQAPHIKSILEPQFGRLWIIHRLDRCTSGVMLLAPALHPSDDGALAAGAQRFCPSQPEYPI